jgi:hypothetical protein
MLCFSLVNPPFVIRVSVLELEMDEKHFYTFFTPTAVLFTISETIKNPQSLLLYNDIVYSKENSKVLLIPKQAI